MADYNEDPYQHIKSITVDATPGVRFNGGTQFGPGILAWPATSVMSVSYWFRTFSNQSSKVLAATDTGGEIPYVEFFGGENSVAVLLAEDPFPEFDAEAEPGGQLQFAAAVGASYGQWHHVAYNCYTAAGVGGKTASMYVDGISNILINRDVGRAFLLPFAGFNYVFGSDGRGDPDTFTIVDISELWIGVGQTVNFSDPLVLQKFRSIEGVPVSLGDHGELPTGIPPVIFGHGGGNDFLQPNLGTGGDLGLSGGLMTVDGPP